MFQFKRKITNSFLTFFKKTLQVKRLKAYTLAVYASCLFSTLCNAQKYTRIKAYSSEDGLSQVSIKCILKDRLGLVWMGTQDGLNRFDGSSFKNFRHRDDDSTSISGNYINALAEDETGVIWVGTQGSGVNRFDPGTNRFVQINLAGSNTKNEIISSIVLDQEGKIWIASRISGLYCLEPVGSDHYHQNHVLSGYSLTKLYISNSNVLWIGSEEGKVFRLKTDQKSPGQWVPVCTINGTVSAFYETDDHLIIGAGNGVYIYNNQNNTALLLHLDKDIGKPTRFVKSFLSESDHSFWMGTGNGLYLYDWKKREVIRKITKQTGRVSLTNNTVESMLRLSENQLLIGTAKDLNLLDFSTPAFKNISKDQKGKHLLNDNVVFSIFKENNNLWVGTSSGGLNLIQNGKSYYFTDDFQSGNILSGTVRGIVKDAKNQRLWFCSTRGLGMIDLTTFNPEKPRFTIFHHEPGNPNSINQDLIMGLALDSDYNVWGATYGAGIFRLEMKQNSQVKIDRIYRGSNNHNGLNSDLTHCIVIDNSDNVWVGSEGGVTHITMRNHDLENAGFTHYFKTPKEGKSLSNNSIYDILIDSEGRIWSGSQHGLNRIDPGNNTIRYWLEQDQFDNALVYSIQNDLAGNLWMGTNDGLVGFDPKKNTFTRYSIEDGIQNKEFDVHAKFRDSSGEIYLGGIGGITYFDSQDLNGMDRAVPIYISQIQLKNHPATAINKKNLQVDFKEFPFYLTFSTIDYRFNQNVVLVYKFKETGVSWNRMKGSEIEFLGLNSGAHTLLVTGMSRGKVWERPPLTIHLSILPPWYASWWAYILYALAIGLFVFWIYRFQLSRKLAIAESDRLKDVNHLKNSLYANITHEFRTPLTIILGLAESLKKNGDEEKSAEVNEPLEIIERNGKRLLTLVNEMLSLSKLEKGNLELKPQTADVIPFVKYLCDSFQSLAHEAGINLVVYAEVDKLIMDFDSEKLASVISNVISNALKFTPPGGNIVVHLNRNRTNSEAFFVIKVKDSGIGISKEAIPHIFNRFYQVDDAMDRNSTGTGLGLALTKELVNLMEGTIRVKSVVSKGSEFIIELPIRTTSIELTEFDLPEPRQFHISEPEKLPIKTPLAHTDLPLVLIIEDSPDVAYYLQTCLKGKYGCIYAEDGQAGEELAFEKIPDVIICDVMMPKKSGFEVCSDLKKDPRTDHIPIIMLTAKVSEKDRLSGLSRGADAYLTKPFSVAELHIRLDQLTQLRQKLIAKIGDDGFAQFLKSKVENPETRFLQKAIKFIHKELDSDHLSSTQLALEMQLSESQLYRKLKAITGKSTGVFIRSVRLQEAKRILQTTDKTISSVAYETGFSDPSWFSRAFKDEFGYAPSAIRK